MRRRLVMAASLAGALASGDANAQGEPITAMDLLNIRQITDVALSPTGDLAVYTLASIENAGVDEKGVERYENRSHLWMVRLDEPDAAPVQLTFGERTDSQPIISPDGARVAFVRHPAKQNGDTEAPKPQVWTIPLHAPGEARQTTSLKHGATAPRWRPDSNALLVASAIPATKLEGEPDWDHERPGRAWRDATVPDPARGNDADASPDGDLQSVRNWLARNASLSNPNVITRLDFQDEHELKKEMRFSHLFLVELDGGEPAQLTRGFRNHNDASFSPDGRSIVFTDTARTREHPDRVWRTSIYLMDADGSNVRSLLDRASHSFNSPRFTPDGRWIVFNAIPMENRLYQQARIGRVRPDGSGESWIAASWPSHMNDPTPTDEGVYFVTPWRGGFPLMFASFRSPDDDPAQLLDLARGAGAFDARNGRVVAAVTAVENPSELHEFPTGRRARRVTAHNASWLENKRLSTPSEHWITRPDGERIQYWVMPPAQRTPGGSSPVALEIHGGPMAMWGPGEFTMWHEFQLLCAWGYGVVYSNPRGSSGYGYEFQRGNHQNWGVDPAADVLACLDDAIERFDWIDPERQFIAGGSYAGYLTAWIVAHTDRFNAAVAQRGVYELTTFFGEGNAWRLVEHAMGGFPWDAEIKSILDRESPFTHVARITTPLLIMHGSNDLRTGVSQSEMMHRALKELGRPVEYVRYPGAGHDLSRSGQPLQRLDRLMRIVEFFERHRSEP